MTDNELSEKVYSELRVCMVRSKLMLGERFEEFMAQCAASILGVQGQMDGDIGFVMAGLTFAYITGSSCPDFHEGKFQEYQIELEVHIKSSIMWYMMHDDHEEKLNELKAILK